MRSHVSLVYGVTGQTVEFYPPDAEVVYSGAPTTAATYRVFGGTQSNDETPKFSGTATLDSASASVTAAAGYSQSDRRSVSVTNGTAFRVGRRYVIANASGQREIVRVAAASSSALTLEEDLSYDYPASTSTVRGLRHVFTVDATFIATLSNINGPGVSALDNLRQAQGVQSATQQQSPPYRVEWAYTTAGEPRRHWTYFDVVRQSAKHHVSVDRVLELWPDLQSQTFRGKRGGVGIMSLIQAGWDRVLMDVRLDGKDPDAIREGPLLDELVIKATLWKAAEAGLSPGGLEVNGFMIEKRNDYLAAMNRALTVALNMWIDTGTTGGITRTPPKPLWLTR